MKDRAFSSDFSKLHQLLPRGAGLGPIFLCYKPFTVQRMFTYMVISHIRWKWFIIDGPTKLQLVSCFASFSVNLTSFRRSTLIGGHRHLLQILPAFQFNYNCSFTISLCTRNAYEYTFNKAMLVMKFSYYLSIHKS